LSEDVADKERVCAKGGGGAHLPVNVVWIARVVCKDNATACCGQKSASDLEDPHSCGITVGVKRQDTINSDTGAEIKNAGKESHAS